MFGAGVSQTYSLGLLVWMVVISLVISMKKAWSKLCRRAVSTVDVNSTCDGTQDVDRSAEDREKDLQIEIHRLRFEKSELNRLIDLLDLSIVRKDNHIRRLRADGMEDGKTIQVLEKEVQGLKNQVEELKEERRKTDQSIKALRKENAALNKDVGKLKDKTTRIQSDVVELKLQVAKAERLEKLAILRQFALNVEDAIRETVLRCLPESYRARYFLHNGTRKELKFSRMEYAEKMEDFAAVRVAVLNTHFGGEQEKFDKVMKMMTYLKKFSVMGAHPTTYKEKAVTHAMMEQFINSSTLNHSDKKRARELASWFQHRNPFLT